MTRMDFSISDEQRMIIETTRAFVENEIFPHEWSRATALRDDAGGDEG